VSYLTHFGLQAPLFDAGIATDASVFLDTSARETLAHAGLAKATRESVVVLSGPAGIGKTTLAAALIDKLAKDTRILAAWLAHVPLTAEEVMESLLEGFGLDASGRSRVGHLHSWRRFMLETKATDTRVLIAIENAEDLEPSVIKALASLTAADTQGCPGANLVLTGSDALDARLRTADAAQLRQRVRLYKRLQAWDRSDLRAYLQHCARRANASLESLFDPDAISLLYEYSRGVPRTVNQICETALELAAAAAADVVTPDCVRSSAVLCGLAELGEELEPPDADDAPPDVAVWPADVDASAACADDIPVLTECVDIGHVGAATEQPVVDVAAPQDERETSHANAVTTTALEAPPVPAPRGAGRDAERSGFDDLSAELVDQILGVDTAPHAAEPSGARIAGDDEAPSRAESRRATG
jgi:type II secretory pathway predicted ATPase ExeA